MAVKKSYKHLSYGFYFICLPWNFKVVLFFERLLIFPWLWNVYFTSPKLPLKNLFSLIIIAFLHPDTCVHWRLWGEFSSLFKALLYNPWLPAWSLFYYKKGLQIFLYNLQRTFWYIFIFFIFHHFIFLFW